MAAGTWFWIIYVLCAALGLLCSWPSNQASPDAWRPFGGNLAVLVLLGLLGWGVFGPPIR